MRSLATTFLLVALLGVAAVSATPTLPIYMNWLGTINTTYLQQGYPTQYSIGVAAWQQDENFNRTSWIGPNGNNFVADFPTQTINFIDFYRVCQYTCPMNGVMVDNVCNAQIDGNSLCNYDYINYNNYIGEEEIDGVMLDHFHWYDPLTGMDMADHDIWITQDPQPVPYVIHHDFHPFGSWVANFTMYYTDFAVGTPAPANFNFTGGEYCQEGDPYQCQEVHKSFKLHMIQAKMAKMVAAAKEGVKIKKILKEF